MVRGKSGVIWYVDGFAGAGRYGDGRDGSPLIGLQEARRIRGYNRGYELASFFVESDSRNWQSLEGLISPFRADGFKIRNELGEFSDFASEIVHTTSGSPILLFVDPFGLKPLDYSRFKPLISRNSPVDLILTFQHTAVPRLATDRPHLVSQAIGTNAWLTEWDRVHGQVDQTEHVIRFFRDNLVRDGGFLNVVSYPIRDRLDRAPRYYLMFASRRNDAFELWNDQMTREDMRLSERQYESLASQSSFLPQFDAEKAGHDLLNSIHEFASRTERFNRRDVVMHFVTGSCGVYHTGDIKRAIASLIAAGKLRWERPKRSKIDTDYMRLG